MWCGGHGNPLAAVSRIIVSGVEAVIATIIIMTVILISCIKTTIINERKIMMIVAIIVIMIMKSVITKLMKVIKRSRNGRKT